jgi:hypothetical protein
MGHWRFWPVGWALLAFFWRVLLLPSQLFDGFLDERG